MCKFLVQLSMDFSSYYNRVHILGVSTQHRGWGGGSLQGCKGTKEETSRPLLSSRSLDHTCLVKCLPVSSFCGLCVKCSMLA